MVWVTCTSVKESMLKGPYRFWSKICSHPSDLFFQGCPWHPRQHLCYAWLRSKRVLWRCMVHYKYNNADPRLLSNRSCVSRVLSSPTLTSVKRKGDVTQCSSCFRVRKYSKWLNICKKQYSLSVSTWKISSLLSIQFNIVQKEFANHCILLFHLYFGHGDVLMYWHWKINCYLKAAHRNFCHFYLSSSPYRFGA